MDKFLSILAQVPLIVYFGISCVTLIGALLFGKSRLFLFSFVSFYFIICATVVVWVFHPQLLVALFLYYLIFCVIFCVLSYLQKFNPRLNFILKLVVWVSAWAVVVIAFLISFEPFTELLSWGYFAYPSKSVVAFLKASEFISPSLSLHDSREVCRVAKNFVNDIIMMLVLVFVWFLTGVFERRYFSLFIKFRIYYPYVFAQWKKKLKNFK
jgi:hypothetical protein